MSEWLSGFSRALNQIADDVADRLTDHVSSFKSVPIYRYKNLEQFMACAKKESPEIRQCKISLTREQEIEGRVYPEVKYLIRVICLDEKSNPIYFDSKQDSYLGTAVIASSIDKQLAEFMKDREERTVVMKG